MNRLRYWLTDSRTLAAIGIAIMAGLFLLGPNTLKAMAFWAGVGLLVLLAMLIALWALHRAQARRASEQMGDALVAGNAGKPGRNADVDALRERLRAAVKSIKTSRLGQAHGAAALYELPWYMIIGNPAAGKSTAVVNSGLHFPFADSRGAIVQGIGGTRHCDWYFTAEGILLDTAGRYSVQDENRTEWLSFLEMLRKHRPRAPINGIVIAASIAELTGNRPEFAINLAKNLRQRVQELTEWLEVIAPVYVVFTKADLIAGFNDFFRTLDADERNRAWGATLPFAAGGSAHAVELFDARFDELGKGLKEMSLAQMALNRGNAPAPGLLTLPLEFSGIKATLRTFIATLFEDNPFQFRPVFRGFYFTSALQEDASVHHTSDRIAQRYGLALAERPAGAGHAATATSYFLRDLFRKVIFADRQLVRQYASRNRVRSRYAVLLGSALVLAIALGGWAWSYTNNRQLVSNVRADLAKVQSVQKDRVDLPSRLEALLILQDRLQQLDAYRDDHPLMLGLGLYQGDEIARQLRREYFHGMRELMLAPVTHNLETYLGKVVAGRDRLAQPGTGSDAPKPVPGAYLAPSPADAQDAYNALKAYLMLGNPARVEPVHLSDQLTRFWREWLDANRGMLGRDQLIGSADRLLGFYVAQHDQPGWPTVDDKIGLVDDTRQSLRHVMRGMPAINRVYAQIEARAATRFPAVSVASILGDHGGALLTGSHAIPGTFTREAWDGYVRAAIRGAANHELNANDWVLETRQHTDLTLSGSPEQIQKQLEELYDKDYISHWQRFLQGISVAPFGSFDAAVKGMNALGDPQDSPLRKVLETVYRQTSWDNPSLVDQGLKSAGGGVVGWFKRVILRRTPVGMDVRPDGAKAPAGTPRAGPVGKAFAGVTRLMIARDGNPPPLQHYLGMLAKLRSRLNTIKNQGDVGPGARTLMQATLGGGGSELSSGLQLVDEQMLDGLDDQQRNTLRPLLLRPLMQTFNALVPPTEVEVNKIWTAQVYSPFEQALARKYPFDPHGQIQATDAETGQVFGPGGAIAKFAGDGLGALVDRRGDTLNPRRWADMGITLSPRLMAGFARWVAPLGQGAGNDGSIVFMLQPEPGSGGISEYTIDINGHALRYRNTPPAWEPFTWNGSLPDAVAKVSALTYDGRTVEVASFAGNNALGMLIKSARASNDGGGNYTLTWARDAIAVTVRLKLVSSAQANADGSQKPGLQGVALPAAVAGANRIDTPERPTTEDAP